MPLRGTGKATAGMASPFSLFPAFFLPLLSQVSSISPSPLHGSTDSIISIPLSTLRSNHLSPSLLPWQKLRYHVDASLIRAHRLKNPRSKLAAPPKTTVTAPLAAQGYGGYSVSLAFGTPPQTLSFVLDTGSNVVWFPCTANYICNNCSFPSPNHRSRRIRSFLPKSSSSPRILGCSNPKCGWIHKLDAPSRCSNCDGDLKNCTQICQPYLIYYGSGSTGGVMLSETLNLPGKRRVPDFAAGCSLFSSRQPAGIAGFGRGEPSLPSQLGLSKFSHCLVSHRFDDSGERGALALHSGGQSSGRKTAGVSYTPFVRNPTGNDVFSAYYYVGLRKITIGGRRVKIPYHFLEPASGGTIVDSGSTFTFMAGEIFKLVAEEFAGQVRGYARAREVEALTGLSPCFNVSGGASEGPASIPEMWLHFKGGVEMKLPLANYVSLVGGDGGALCLTMLSDGDVTGVGGGGGPAIILGNFQMQNFYVEYDLGNERLGFRPQRCSK